MSFGLAALGVAVATIFIRHAHHEVVHLWLAGVTGASRDGRPVSRVVWDCSLRCSFFSLFLAALLSIGLLTRLFALGFVCDMLGAILLVQLKSGFSHYELEFLLLGSSLALVLAGAGEFSVDALLGRRDAKG